MEIERINENTVKFFISYGDVEERGFDREEIWYNREKSEELFWEVMDEVNEKEDFPFDGPLWIQVQALEKGLEIFVTRAQLSKDGSRLELPIDEKTKGFSFHDGFEDFIDHQFQLSGTEADDDETMAEDENSISLIAYFNDFEDIIALSKRPYPEKMLSKLFSLDGKYYLYLEFSFDDFTEDEIDNYLSVLFEYATESQRTIHYLQEYGNEIISEHVFEKIRQHF